MKKLEEIKQLSLDIGVPIIMDETCDILSLYIEDKKPKKILEIGGGVGYSAAVMLKNSMRVIEGQNFGREKVTLITVEKDGDRFKFLQDNLKGWGAGCINADAGEILQEFVKMKRKFDFVFLDGPKGQYARYFPMIDKLLSCDGVLFADNVNFHGMVTGEIAVTKGARSIVRGLIDFRKMVAENINYQTKIIDKGDGILIAVKIASTKM